MAAKKSQSVTLDQTLNPTFVEERFRAEYIADGRRNLPEGHDEQYRYKVLSLKNVLEPGVGTVIRKRDVERLMKEGVDVTIVKK